MISQATICLKNKVANKTLSYQASNSIENTNEIETSFDWEMSV